jgi:hypothetical protein
MLRIRIIGLMVVAPLIIALLVQTGQLKRSYPYTVLEYRNLLVVPSTPMYLNAALWDDTVISFPDVAHPFPADFPQTCDSLLWDTATFCLQPTDSPSSQLHMFKTYGDGAIYAMQGSLPPTRDTSCGFYPTVCPLTGVRNDACAVMYNTTFSDVVVSTDDGRAYCSSTPDQSSFFAPPITCQSVTDAGLTCPRTSFPVCLARVLYCSPYSPGYYTVSQYDLYANSNLSIPGMVLYFDHTSETVMNVTYVTSDGHTDTVSFPVNGPYTINNASTFSSHPLTETSSYTCIKTQGQPTPTVAIWTINPTTQSCLINGSDINLVPMYVCEYRADPDFNFSKKYPNFHDAHLVVATNYINGIITYEEAGPSSNDDTISGLSWQIPVDPVSSEVAYTSLWPQVSPPGWYCDFDRCVTIVRVQAAGESDSCLPPYEATTSFVSCINDDATGDLVSIPAQSLEVAMFAGKKYAFIRTIGSSDIDYAILQVTSSQPPSLGQYVASAFASTPGTSIPLTPISGVGGESCFRQGCNTTVGATQCLNGGRSFCVVFNENDAACPTPPP